MDKETKVELPGNIASRTWALPASSSKVLHVPVNLSALRDRIVIVLTRTLLFCDELSNLYTGGDQGAQVGIQGGIDAVSSLTVLLVYEYLRLGYGKFGDGHYTHSKLPPGPFTLEKSIPAGLCTLVEQFGYAEAKDVYGNPRYLHVWDGEYGETFGLKPDYAAVDEAVLHGFLKRLRMLHVPFRCIQNSNFTTRTLWDSLLIEATGNDAFTFMVSMTHPRSNYKFPEDIYTAIILCGPSHLRKGSCVAFYAPRLSRFDHSKAVNDAKSHELVEASDDEMAAMPSIHIADGLTEELLRVNGHLRGFHLSGVHKPHSDSVPTIWIYGRGNIEDTLTISELIQPIRTIHHYDVCDDLIKSGKIPNYWLPNREYTKGQTIAFREIHHYPVIEVPVNLNSLRDNIIQLIENGFGTQIRMAMYSDMWDEAELLAKEYDEKICQLATAVVLAIRDRLCILAINRRVSQRHLELKPCYHQNEFPSGICYIIEQFGYCQAKSTPGNPTYQHVWDGEDLPEMKMVFHWSSLEGMLKREGVTFRHIDNSDGGMERSLWDSLFVEKSNNNGYDVYTTFSSDNYILPRDVFLAIMLCGESSLANRRPIEYYAPRMSKYTRPQVTSCLEQHSEVTDEYELLNGTLSNMNMAGNQRIRENDKEEELACWIYGRGGAQQSMKINSVGRWMSEYDMIKFAKALLLKGATSFQCNGG